VDIFNNQKEKRQRHQKLVQFEPNADQTMRRQQVCVALHSDFAMKSEFFVAAKCVQLLSQVSVSQSTESSDGQAAPADGKSLKVTQSHSRQMGRGCSSLILDHHLFGFDVFAFLGREDLIVLPVSAQVWELVAVDLQAD